jgi:hypothetical protein
MQWEENIQHAKQEESTGDRPVKSTGSLEYQSLSDLAETKYGSHDRPGFLMRLIIIHNRYLSCEK